MIEYTTVPSLPPRKADSHKGTYGRVLIVAGSKGMSGAAVLCGSAALRSGAGLVTVACPPDIQDIVAAGNPCYMTVAIPQTIGAHFGLVSAAAVVDFAEGVNVLAVGPGLGNRPDVAELVQMILEAWPTQPLVLDADALNVLNLASLTERTLPAVLTPHPGEFARLLKISSSEVQNNRQALAVKFAQHHKVVLVLKGNGTIVTDGERVYRNDTGNPGMATGGSGDVLTGCIAALLGQGLPPFEAAVRGVWSHGKAGDMVAERTGQIGLIATDLIDALPLTLGS
ncbi:MAG: NAD(P)H-hydrate dehydratase [Gemmataceae bacterium]